MLGAHLTVIDEVESTLRLVGTGMKNASGAALTVQPLIGLTETRIWLVARPGAAPAGAASTHAPTIASSAPKRTRSTQIPYSRDGL